MNKTPINALLGQVEWKECEVQVLEGDMPYATHSGVLQIGNGPPIRCHRLNTGQAVFDADDIERFFDSIWGED